MSIFSRKQSVEIDYDKLADAIVKAQQKADTQTIKNAIIEANSEIKDKELTEQNTTTEKWHKVIGYNENNSELKNNFCTFIKLITIKKDEVVSNFANNALLKSAICVLYFLLEYLIYALCILFIVMSFFTHSLFLFSIPIDIFAFIIARIIRLARFEVVSIQDKNYLFSLFSVLMSIIALVVAIITVFINK